jgi:IS5 family transposase
MLKKETPAPTFAEQAVQHLLDPDEWLLRLRDSVDWKPLERKLETLYAKDVGRPAVPPLALFRVLLLQRFYNLSDPAMARQLRYHLLFQAFAGLSVENATLDDTTIALFRKRLAEGGLDEWAFEFFARECEKRGLVIKEGTLIDATMVRAAVGREAKRPDGRPQDGDAEWGRKSEKSEPVFGYKAHVAVDEGSHLIRAVEVTPADVHDSQAFEAVLPKGTKSVCADKAYDSQQRRRRLKERGIAARILFKGKRGEKLSGAKVRLNRLWSKRRGRVEAAFCSLKRWCGMPRIRYLGEDGARLQVYLSALAHNLKRMAKLERAKAEACA